MIKSIVTTCLRPNGANYIEDSVGSIWEAGFSPTIFCDGPPPEFPHWVEKNLTVKWHNWARIGIVPSYRLAMAYGIRGSDRFVIFQDDVIVAKGLGAWIGENTPTDGIVSLYTPAARTGPSGWQEQDFSPTADDAHPWLHSVGGCALLFTAEIARELVEMPPPFRIDRLGAWIGEFCYNTETPFYCHSPSLVQHIGKQSCREFAPFNGDRQASHFCEDVKNL